MDCEDFDCGENQGSETFPIQVGDLRVGKHCMIKEHPCRIVEYDAAKTGKHGHAKARIVGIDIFTQKKYEDSFQTSENIQVPSITKKEYTLVHIDNDDFCTLMDKNSQIKEDLKLPDDDYELSRKIKYHFN